MKTKIIRRRNEIMAAQKKRKYLRKKCWYYERETGEISSMPHEEFCGKPNFDYCGPFRTFEQAQKDAIGRFQVDLRLAQTRLFRARNFTKKYAD